MALFTVRTSRVIRIELSVSGIITAQETHGEGLVMGCSSITSSLSILSMASETPALRWYGTDLGGTATDLIEFLV